MMDRPILTRNSDTLGGAHIEEADFQAKKHMTKALQNVPGIRFDRVTCHTDQIRVRDFLILVPLRIAPFQTSS